MKLNHQHALKIGTELDPETSGKLHILLRLSAGGTFIEFCRRETFKTLGSKNYKKIISEFLQLNKGKGNMWK
jgi:hypothetical protein